MGLACPYECERRFLMTMLLIGALTVFALPAYACVTSSGYYESNRRAVATAFFAGLLAILILTTLFHPIG